MTRPSDGVVQSARRRVVVLATLLATAFASAAGAQVGPQKPASSASSVPAIEPPDEDPLIPAFPGSRATRLRLESEFVPPTSVEDGNDVTTYAPSARLRIAAPVTDRLGAQFIFRYGATFYDFDGATDPFGTGPRRGNPFDEFHEVDLRLQAALDLSGDSSLFFDGEKWSAFVEGRGFTRFEAGAFDDGFGGGAALALGYEFPKRFQLAAGVAFGVGTADGSLRVRPVGKVQWRVTDDLTIANRGRGVQVEYRLLRELRLLGAWFRTGRTWRLENRRGLPGRLRWQDRQSRALVGLEWRLHRQLRLRLETGAVYKRKLEVDSRDETLSDVDGDATGFVLLSFEIRP